MKIGRNAPCPCGSGKKYKKCCLGKKASPNQTLYYRRLSEAHDRLVDRLLAYAERTFGKEAVGVAMQEFLLWPEPEDDISEEMIDRVATLFWPWYLFNWEYNSFDAEVELSGPEDRTIAELYAQDRAGRLDSLERHLIDGINRKPYSFWEVRSVDKGKSIKLQNVLQGTHIEVQEHTASESVEPGDLVFGRAVSVSGVGMLIGLGSALISPRHKPYIIQFRKRLRHGQSSITDETLFEWDAEIRELYFDIDRSLHTPPQLSNTDGDSLELHRLIYEVLSVEEAFEKLCDLCVSYGPDELSVDAERDDKGRIVRVEIPWDRKSHKASAGMSNTLLGRIMIDGHRMTAEVNSAKRAEALRHEIDVRLGDSCRFKLDEIQDMDAVMSQRPAGTVDKKMSSEHEELMQLPEVQEQLAEMMNKHWENWVDDKIPALGDISPREALKTADGREAVEALLQDAERGQGQDTFIKEATIKGAKWAREMLGLK